METTEKFEDALKRINTNNEEIFSWVDKEYNNNFVEYFKIPIQLYEKLKANKITDDELTEVMLNLPLDLMEVSEVISQYKASNEVIKDSTKRFKLELSSIKDKTAYEYIDLNYKVLNNDLILNVNSTLIERVEKQVTMCKELIMGAKKIWDARRKSEQAMPISPSSNVGSDKYQ